MANRYFLNIGTSWGSTANWSDTSGGTGGFSIPTSADDVFFDANSGNCTLASSTRSAKSINFTGYTNTVTFDVGLDVYGSVTLSSGMTIAGVGTLSLYAIGNLTSNGKLWPNLLVFRGTSQTYTLVDNWTVGSLQGLASTAATINGNTINVNGDLTITGTAIYSGTTNIVLSGTGTYSQNSTGQLRNNLTINTSGTITISGNIYYNTGTLTYTAGTVITTGSTLSITIATTLNTNGMIWDNITTTTTVTITNNSPLTISGTYSHIIGTVNWVGSTITIGGSIVNGGNIANNTSLFILNGSGTLSTTGTGSILCNLTINTTGTYMIIGTSTVPFKYSSGTFTLISGNVIANTATLNITSSATFINCDKINFRTINITAATTQTFNKFFSGSAATPTRIQSTGANYTIAFQDGFEKITKFTRISNCTVTKRGQLLCITDKSNKGGNVGVRYINQLPNGVAKNSPSVPTTNSYGTSLLVADPSFQTL